MEEKGAGQCRDKVCADSGMAKSFAVAQMAVLGQSMCRQWDGRQFCCGPNGSGMTVLLWPKWVWDDRQFCWPKWQSHLEAAWSEEGKGECQWALEVIEKRMSCG